MMKDNMDYYDLFAAQLPRERLYKNEPMKLHTSFRVGGPADVLFLPESEEELILALKLAREASVPCTVIGNGSNLLVRDGGLSGLTIKLGEPFSGIEISGDLITARAGESLAHVARAALEACLTGLEFASGIPGSVGGGMAMDAGAYGGELKDVCVSARLLDPKTFAIADVPVQDLCMAYRSTRMLQTGELVLKASFRLQKGDYTTIRDKMDDLNQRRRDKQPLNFPSAGSTFKRPEGHFAGQLIEQAGLKGVSVGGAQVSPKHAGFIVNAGDATAKDILDLMALVTKRVYEQSGVQLEPEVRILGEDLQ